MDFFDVARKYVIIWWLKVLKICYTMADITPTSSTLKDLKLRTGAIKGINPANPNDVAFELVTHFCVFFVMQKIIPFFLLSTSPPPLTSFII
jgi:hypothetical protein